MKIKFLTAILLFLFCLSGSGYAQKEVLTNSLVIEMSKAGLSKEIILQKVKSSNADYDASAAALIELKKAGVDDEIIAAILEKAEKLPANSTSIAQGFSENQPANEVQTFDKAVTNPKESLLSAKTVAIEKSSLNPSRQALEKALFKRKEWQKYNLTLVRYKDAADGYIEIGRIPLTWLTHRYVFRIYDRRTGTIITAGETTSWGSLAENLAREITQKLDGVTSK